MAQVEFIRTDFIKKASKSTKGGTYYVLSLLPWVGVAALVLGGALHAIPA